MIVDQSNIYSVQEIGHSINMNCNEMAAFISILLYTGLVKMSAFIDFWAQGTRFESIADAMPLKRFQKLRRFIHFNDNTEAGNSDDRYFKIRPVWKWCAGTSLPLSMRNNFMLTR